MSKSWKSPNIGMFIFRRDLRIVDNVGLSELAKVCKQIYTIFIFTPEQITDANKYKSDNAVQFMLETLSELSDSITRAGGQLFTFFGTNELIVEECIKYWHVNIVATNKDITPYAIKRDHQIENICKKHNIQLLFGEDYYLQQPGSIVNGSGQPYQKFTPYYNKAVRLRVAVPLPVVKLTKPILSSPKHQLSIESAIHRFTSSPNNYLLVHGGRSLGLKCLTTAVRTLVNYNHTRDELIKPTSRLSAYIKFGCVSVREVYKAFNRKTDFLRQLYWRDFYANILYSYPHVLEAPLKLQYNKIKWGNNTSWFNKWCEGTTGFPIVDAGMRELNATGYCHNRARLIVMSFLVKILLVDYRRGEQYFAKKLTDYDVASNNGNTQWVMGGGADSQPYYRIFNPWMQTKNHDPKCEYIKKWVPELKNISVKTILNWDTSTEQINNYPRPIVDYTTQKEKVLNLYTNALKH